MFLPPTSITIIFNISIFNLGQKCPCNLSLLLMLNGENVNYIPLASLEDVKALDVSEGSASSKHEVFS